MIIQLACPPYPHFESAIEAQPLSMACKQGESRKDSRETCLASVACETQFGSGTSCPANWEDSCACNSKICGAIARGGATKITCETFGLCLGFFALLLMRDQAAAAAVNNSPAPAQDKLETHSDEIETETRNRSQCQHAQCGET